MKKPDTVYKETLASLKEEQMNWDFADFLNTTEKETPLVPVTPKKKPTWLWAAAGIVLLISFGLYISIEKQPDASHKDTLVQQEILKNKEQFFRENRLALQTADTAVVRRDSIQADSTMTADEVDTDRIMDQILPRRGRIRKESKPRYAHINNKENNSNQPEYHAGYVIINGQKVENEQEAIDLAKFSIRILSDKVAKTVAHTAAISDFDND